MHLDLHCLSRDCVWPVRQCVVETAAKGLQGRWGNTSCGCHLQHDLCNRIQQLIRTAAWYSSHVGISNVYPVCDVQGRTTCQLRWLCQAAPQHVTDGSSGASRHTACSSCRWCQASCGHSGEQCQKHRSQVADVCMCILPGGTSSIMHLVASLWLALGQQRPNLPGLPITMPIPAGSAASGLPGRRPAARRLFRDCSPVRAGVVDSCWFAVCNFQCKNGQDSGWHVHPGRASAMQALMA